MIKVFTNGCFDVLTAGHFNLLMYCRKIAGEKGKVIVAIDEDEKIMASKGLHRPIFNVHERAKALLDLRMPDNSHVVDDIAFFHTDLELEMMIKRLGPDYLVKGSDWEGRSVVGSQFTRVRFYNRVHGYSSTEIIQRCQARGTVRS